ncbi:hypothetical protein MTR_0065s0050 [Medicago truncatula]|uniref:Uncharacterized protein n=1 Tax=Medicago truncatula TaxID=3880 RepID=A0A072THA3_MEDTR|nr:hypothetical protein MTR_0065s0050 [Medicago truncatula]
MSKLPRAAFFCSPRVYLKLAMASNPFSEFAIASRCAREANIQGWVGCIVINSGRASALERLVVQSGGTRVVQSGVSDEDLCPIKECFNHSNSVGGGSSVLSRALIRGMGLYCLILSYNSEMAGRNDAAIAAALEAVAQAVGQHPNVAARNGEVRMLETFLRNHPPAFKGRYDPDGAQKWLKEVDRIFRVMQCSEVQKVRFGTHMLAEEADN